MNQSAPQLLKDIFLPELPGEYVVVCLHFVPPKLDADPNALITVDEVSVFLQPNESILEGSTRLVSYVGDCPKCGKTYICHIRSHN